MTLPWHCATPITRLLRGWAMPSSTPTLLQLVKRKALTLAKDPVGTLSNQRHRLRAAYSAWQLERHGVLELLGDFQRQRPRNASPTDLGDCWFLYATIRRRRPALILEFGSGNSTLVQAQALYDNAAGGRLISIDASPLWAASTKACLPPHLQGTEVLYHPAVEVEMYGVRGWRHQGMPALSPNFVYLDGPALTRERQVAVDLLDLEAAFPPDFFLVIDDRKANTAFLRAHFTRHYTFRRRAWRGTNPTFALIP